MQLSAQDFLRLVDGNNSIGFLDIESTGLRGDYNSMLVGSVARLWDNKPSTVQLTQPGNDKKVVREFKELLEGLDCWVSYYGKGFDIPFVNTRLLKWGYNFIEPRPHVDMYYTLKYHTLTARRSQSHLLSFFETPEQKMSVGAEVWNEVLRDPKKAIPILIDRVESDVLGLRDLFLRTRHVIREIKR